MRSRLRPAVRLLYLLWLWLWLRRLLSLSLQLRRRLRADLWRLLQRVSERAWVSVSGNQQAHAYSVVEGPIVGVLRLD